jgi:hypothetical protein
MKNKGLFDVLYSKRQIMIFLIHGVLFRSKIMPPLRGGFLLPVNPC